MVELLVRYKLSLSFFFFICFVVGEVFPEEIRINVWMIFFGKGIDRDVEEVV